MADGAEPPAYCTRKPVPGQMLSDTCPDCGHLLAVHVGTRHCPVCELVDLAERHRAAVEPAQTEEPPKTGDRLHLWSIKHGCIAGTLERHMVFAPGLLIKVDRQDLPLDSLVAEAHDESRTANGSWHWPCDGNDATAEPAPDHGSPIHFRHPNSSTVCLDAEIVSTEDDGTSTITFPGGMNRRGVAEDQSGRGADTWHWPCSDSDEPAAEPAPEPSDNGPVINITVNGSILSERDLADTIRRVLWSDKLRDLRDPGAHFRR